MSMSPSSWRCRRRASSWSCCSARHWRVISPIAPRSRRRPERCLSAARLSPHIVAMPKKPKSPTRPTRAKASKPEVHPLDDHLAALLNPALIEKPPGFAEAATPFDGAPLADEADEDAHPRGMSGAAATVESLKALLELGDPNIRGRAPWTP